MTEKIWLSASDLAEMLEISLSKSYKLIKTMNQELEEKGFLVLPGKIPVAYVRNRLYLE